MARNTHFWNQLLMRSDSIADIDSQAGDAREQILGQLTAIGEQFDRSFDPADQFEEYVAVALCQALQRALTPKSTASCKMLSPNPMPTRSAMSTPNSVTTPSSLTKQNSLSEPESKTEPKRTPAAVSRNKPKDAAAKPITSEPRASKSTKGTKKQVKSETRPVSKNT